MGVDLINAGLIGGLALAALFIAARHINWARARRWGFKIVRRALYHEILKIKDSNARRVLFMPIALSASTKESISKKSGLEAIGQVPRHLARVDSLVLGSYVDATLRDFVPTNAHLLYSHIVVIRLIRLSTQ